MSSISILSRLSQALPPSRSKTRFGRLLTRVIHCTRKRSVVEVKLRDGSRMLLDTRSRTEAGALWNGEYDQDDLDFFKICVSPNDVIFDVGANVGLITILLARYVRDHGGGSLLAFEPVQSNFDRLVDNIALNKLGNIVTPFNIALGDQEGEITMAVEARSRWFGEATTGNAVIRESLGPDPQFRASKARITRLDSFVVDHHFERVDLIKVDVEGAELMFLRGSLDFVAKTARSFTENLIFR